MKTHTAKSSLLAAIPLSLARSALFQIGRAEPGTTYKREPVAIAPQRGARLARTGVSLDQQHALAWQAVLHLAAEANVGDSQAFTVGADDLLRVLGGKGGDSKQRRRMSCLLVDLAHTAIDYQTVTHHYRGPLLLPPSRDPKTNRLVLRLPPELPALLAKEVLRNDLERKAGLGLNGLALWLHDYIATHLRPPAVEVSTLRHWCGATQDLARFRQNLRRALQILAPKVSDTDTNICQLLGPAPGALVLNWDIDRRDRLHVEKSPTGVAIFGAVKAGRGKWRESQIEQARMQRADLNQ